MDLVLDFSRPDLIFESISICYSSLFCRLCRWIMGQRSRVVPPLAHRPARYPVQPS
ncbi:hypothetical protein BS78_04G035700 [Paspalum vaginatum]|nr:hypothetical protein BS78_04G035700 [Paspalum vaginatum]